MSALSGWRSRLASRLEWRLLAAFLVVALLPLALSDWFATSAMSGIAQGLAQERDGLAARTASRQVFDRLVLSRTLLAAIDEADGAVRERLAQRATGPGGAFADVRCAPDDATLAARWAGARAGASGATPRASTGATLRFAPRARGDADMLLATGDAATLRCIALLAPDYLWEPLHDGPDNSRWDVRADDGSTVVAWRGADAAAMAPNTLPFTTHLFLASEFGSGNWTLQQRAAVPVVAWYGRPLGAWLGSVAAATLLVIGLLARRTIRRTLSPLAALTEGSRRLAAGAERTRVTVARHDELGELADSFNDMAAQLEQRLSSLRALALIDAGILRGAPFAELAEAVVDRLAQVHPAATVVVAWRVDEARLAALRHDVDGRHPLLELAPHDDALQAFDALPPTSGIESLRGLGAELATPRGGHASGPGVVLGVGDGRVNRAAILLLGLPPGADTDQARALRDRLAVAVVARDREHQLEHRATHDQLTGLRNAWGLQQVLDPMIVRDERLALLFIDLDDFKNVNDCYGHAMGDRLLQAVSRRLERSVAGSGVVSRNGGDEFVVLLPGADAVHAQDVARRILAELHPPFLISTTEHRTGASVGIALHPDHGLDRDNLLRCADIAMYESKANGRNRATLFQPALDTQIRERNELLSGLARGLERAEFIVHYQPRLRAATGAVVAAEALVRWQHPERGLLLPGAFIDLAESSGHIEALGLVVMAAAIAQAAAWRRDGAGIERVSVNVSQHQFASGTLVDTVRAMLLAHALEGRHLEVEVTESVLGGDVASVARQLQALRAMGITVAMDDFGTGFSSLSQLRTLPIDVMKVDRAFVKDLESDPAAVAITRTIVTLARALDLHVVAEGIETPEQARLLSELGCDEFQGFLFSRPVPADRCAGLGPFEVPGASA